MLDSPQSDTGHPAVAAPDSAIADYGHVRRAIEFISAEWQRQPDLAELAAHLNLSPAYCQRLFKRWCGVSPKEFVQAITMDHARKALDRSASVLDATFEVGLSGPSRLHDLFIDHEAMTPGEYKRRGAGLVITHGFHPCPFGLALVMTTLRGVCGVTFCDDVTGQPAAMAEMTKRWPEADFVEGRNATASAARSIFQPDSAPKPPVRLVMIGTDFETTVWRALTDIPVGTTVSYGELAARIGKPGSARATGSAIGRNPLGFVVPCHRVIAKSGDVGGYRWGTTRKRAIIGWEQVRLPAGKAAKALDDARGRD